MTLILHAEPRTRVWAELAAHAVRFGWRSFPELFERDLRCFERFSREHGGLLMDLSRQRLGEIALAKLCQLADATGHEMDEHFRSAPSQQKLPTLMGLTAVWNINFMYLPTLAVLTYDDSLRHFPAYLQQLEIESNGKSVMCDSRPAERQTAAVIWG